MINKVKYYILILFIGIISNIALAFIVLFLNIPFLFMDSIGTILTAVILGPLYGAIVGIITNLITSVTIDYINLHFAIVNVLIGLIAGFIARKYDFTKIKVSIISGLIIAIIAGSISAPISIILAKGFTTGTIDQYIKALINSGKSLTTSASIGTFLTNISDKIVSCLLVSLSVKNVYFFYYYNLNSFFQYNLEILNNLLL